jgi:hypothetical protein
MMQASTRFYLLRAEQDGLDFDLVPNPGLDMKTYRVEVDVQNDLYTCGCSTFEMCGLICPHVIRVMIHLNVQQIPERYMLHRWSAAGNNTCAGPWCKWDKIWSPRNKHVEVQLVVPKDE